MSYDLTKNTGKVRTDLDCHDCGGFFCAVIDYDVDGCHVAICPKCGHQHFRVIKNGVCTEDRWNSSAKRVAMTDIKAREKQPIVTSSRSAFLRDRWLNREG